MIDSTQSFRFFNRGPSPAVRLVFFAMLSLLLLFIDARFRYLESTRSALSVLVSPIQHLATLPGVLWHQAGDFYLTQSAQNKLAAESEAMHQQHQLDAAQLLQLQALQQENQQIRTLADLPQPGGFTTQLAEILYAERNVFQRKVLISKGSTADVQIGQVVMDDAGIVGQITRVYPGLSEVTLITERDYAVPVQVLRNGLRSILFGSGDIGQLSLRYMPASSDIRDDDILITSGIDGIYPPGIPVAKIMKIERDPAYPFARVTCLPLGGVDKHRHLLILSNLGNLPERPSGEAPASTTEKHTGKKRKN